jgi:hypothetical protein
MQCAGTSFIYLPSFLIRISPSTVNVEYGQKPISRVCLYTTAIVATDSATGQRNKYSGWTAVPVDCPRSQIHRLGLGALTWGRGRRRCDTERAIRKSTVVRGCYLTPRNFHLPAFSPNLPSGIPQINRAPSSPVPPDPLTLCCSVVQLSRGQSLTFFPHSFTV